MGTLWEVTLVLHPQAWGRPDTLSHCKKNLILQGWCYLMVEGWDEGPLSAAGKGKAGQVHNGDWLLPSHPSALHQALSPDQGCQHPWGVLSITR